MYVYVYMYVIGIAACYRGTRVFDTDETKEIVIKWVNFYKTYRSILISDIIHIRRADGQSIDAFMHANPQLDIPALIMVFNPTQHLIKNQLQINMYYTGVWDTAFIYEQGNQTQQFKLSVDRNYNILLPITLNKKSITWFIVKKY